MANFDKDYVRQPALSRRAFIGTLLVSGAALPLLGCSASDNSPAEGGSDAAGKLRVVATFYTMADFAQKIGGDYVSVSTLVPTGTEPHDWEPSTTDMQTLEAADVFIYNGAGMETWVDDVLAGLGSDTLRAVEASAGVDLIYEDEEGNQQPNPHVWLAPELAKQELANIRDAFAEAEAAHAEDFRANYDSWAAHFDELDGRYTSSLADVPNKTIVVSHRAFSYLCQAYGLEQVAIEGMNAEGEPDAQAMAEIVDFVKQTGVHVIFTEELVSPKVAQQIASETGATCEVLNPLEGLTDKEISAGKEYVSVMDENLSKLVEALS